MDAGDVMARLGDAGRRHGGVDAAGHGGKHTKTHNTLSVPALASAPSGWENP
ncbi:hypothetical protein GCM10010517_06190 [Streptosporangium fragile]|uniref:Transposase n=1 Tax=Streptosporangium fragile TaxID=46186 RepID=A0ABN3VRJ1_9ACTN